MPAVVRKRRTCPNGQNASVVFVLPISLSAGNATLACGYDGSAFQAVYTQLNLHKLYYIIQGYVIVMNWINPIALKANI
ncbi:MAG: hypothetical protein LBG92_11960 [Prevotellaceae bacterium]|nr:hypothetical protein [Prevotellaceae bacterium]